MPELSVCLDVCVCVCGWGEERPPRANRGCLSGGTVGFRDDDLLGVAFLQYQKFLDSLAAGNLGLNSALAHRSSMAPARYATALFLLSGRKF